MSGRARFLAVAACCAFPPLSHLGATLGEPRLSALGAMLLAWVILGGRFSGVPAVALALLLLGLGLTLATLFPAAMLYTPPLALNLALCATFAATLRDGQEALVSRFARAERGGDLPPDLTRYTRTLTGSWAVFFALMAAISLSLALWGSILAWSLFTNLGNYLLVVLFFALEYSYRRLRFRHYRHATPGELVRLVAEYRVFPRPGEGR